MQLKDVIRTNVGGLTTACITRKQLVELMIQRISDYKNADSEFYNQNMTIYSANGHSISIANSDPRMKNILNKADILHADGQSVVSFSRKFSDYPIPERSATTDTIHDVPLMNSSDVNHFLLGAKNETISSCSEIMSKKYENFKVVGYNDGYFSELEQEQIVNKINESGADVLWVGLGKPKEQEFIHNLRDKIKVPVIISCGGCYNFITGDYARAPGWMQNLGIEWLHRAFTQPKKLLWRYLTTNPHAIYCVIKHRYVGNG
jgi:N-acetylglucosaminyldiphosphoundecaprenol N-acetyl-beta-D-mannosaminyltransferase